ncbi:alanine aminotransferase 2 [Xenentodon cancila]
MTSLLDVNPRVRAIRLAASSSAQSPAPRIQLGAANPLKEVIDVCSGDPQRAGMKPLSFVRQVLAACLYPELLKDESLPLDVRMRALTFLEACDGESLGSYTASSGLQRVRESIAEFIAARDAGIPAHSNNVFISSGAQRALMVAVKLLSRGEGLTQTGVLTPLPCPRTLPRLLDEAGVTAVPYLLREDQGWAVDLHELHRALQTSRGRCEPRAIYVSNPGDPTGHVQDRKSIEEVIQFAAAERLLLLVDEVYQDSVYSDSRNFISYKKVLFEMHKEFRETVELISFHSLSCACVAECGLRAGYLEVVNMDPEVMHFLDSMLCTDISAPVTGQLALDVMLKPPKPGDPSYLTYTQETLLTLATLSQNARRALEVLNGLPGMSCQPAIGGIYLYPRLHLPAEFREQAKALGLEADVLYCQKLLEEERLFVGAGHQRETADSVHLRLCVLVSPDMLEEVLSRLSSFHLRIMDGHVNVDRDVTVKYTEEHIVAEPVNKNKTST